MATGHPWLVISVSLALAVVSVLFTMSRLAFQSERSDLVDPTRPWNARYAEYKKEFPHWDDVVVVVSAAADGGERLPLTDPGLRVRLVRFLHDLASRLAGEPTIASVMIGEHRGPRSARGMLCQPEDEFKKQLARLQEYGVSSEYATPTEYLNARRALVEELDAQGKAAEGDAAFEETMAFLARLAEEAGSATPPEASDSAGDGMPGFQPYFSRSGEFAFVSISLADGHRGAGVAGASAAPAVDGIAVVRRHIRELIEDHGYAALQAGVTGITAIEGDETSQSIRDATLTSALAAALICLLLLFVFRGFVLPLVAMISLLVGIAWSFGYLTLAVGHLQVLSVVFTAILLGLGIDFGLHLLTQLESAHACDVGVSDDVDLWSAAFRNVGPGIVTGALTTAAAFGVTALTDFKGMAEMGLIASGGILLCLMAILCLLPAVLTRVPGWRRKIRTPESLRWSIERILMRFWVKLEPASIAIVAVGLVLILVLATGLRSVKFDADIMNLHAPGVESVTWERRLLESEGQTAWTGLSIAHSVEEARDRTLRLLQLPEIGSVEGVGGLFHPDWEARRQAALSQIPDMVGLPVAAPQGFIQRDLLYLSVINAVRSWMDHSPPPRAAALNHMLIEMVADQLNGRFQGGPSIWETYLRQRAWLYLLRNVLSDPTPMGLEDLPDVVRRQDIGRDGSSLLLRINPVKGEESALESTRLAAFVEAMRTVDPEVMGPAVQIYESSRLIVKSYIEAAVWAVLIILVILLLDFRCVPDALCAILPVGAGFVFLFGLMGWWEIPLNFANIIVLPIIFGIGVDAGVHVVHRWRLDPQGVPKGLTAGTARGISLTMLTTIIGFACMMTAHHRGIQTLGLTMTLGLAATWAICFTILPAILFLRTPRSS